MVESIKLRLRITKAQARKLSRVSRWEFDTWIGQLREDVIEDEFGYEPGEFTVYPGQWRPLWREGLTPREAFQRALDGFAEQRRREDAERAANWARITAEDAALARAQQGVREVSWPSFAIGLFPGLIFGLELARRAYVDCTRHYREMALHLDRYAALRALAESRS